jgi:DNA-binding beta-propeller fold protein YncE
MTNKIFHKTLYILVAINLLCVATCLAQAHPSVNYIYTLSRFTGPVAYSWARLATDPQNQEVYVLNSKNRSVDIYNREGMEVYSFGVDTQFGSLQDITADPDGNLFVLVTRVDGRHMIKLNFRGDYLNEMPLLQLPEEFSGFSPNRLVLDQEVIFLADLGSKQIIKVDLNGRYLAGYKVDDLLTQVSDEDKTDFVMNDFALDKRGRPIFTMSLLWQAGVLNQDGSISTFGKRGDAPGKFGIISGIAADKQGRLYVSDILRSVVLVFDEHFQFLTEFGGRGGGPSNLIGPSHLAMEGDLLYVTQLRDRGVSVFRRTDSPD